jgi:hypothetical protein
MHVTLALLAQGFAQVCTLLRIQLPLCRLGILALLKHTPQLGTALRAVGLDRSLDDGRGLGPGGNKSRHGQQQ